MAHGVRARHPERPALRREPAAGWRPYPAVRKVPLSVTTITAPEFASAYEVSGQGAVLVRPDGHVANHWQPLRQNLDIASATRFLAAALSGATGHPPVHPNDLPTAPRP